MTSVSFLGYYWSHYTILASINTTTHMKPILFTTIILVALACTEADQPLIFPQSVSAARTSNTTTSVLRFAGLDWTVKDAADERVGPGPNVFKKENVWVDRLGKLHLMIRKVNDVWTCAEIYTQRLFGYGKYHFWVEGRVDRLNQNVVLGLFQYPCVNSNCEPSGTHEIDIEFARFGNPTVPSLNYTLWPVNLGGPFYTEGIPVSLPSSTTTHRFTRSASSVIFQSLNGFRTNNSNQFATRTVRSPQYSISNINMPVHINLWLFRGMPPTDEKEIEVIVNRFSYTVN